MIQTIDSPRRRAVHALLGGDAYLTALLAGLVRSEAVQHPGQPRWVRWRGSNRPARSRATQPSRKGPRRHTAPDLPVLDLRGRVHQQAEADPGAAENHGQDAKGVAGEPDAPRADHGDGKSGPAPGEQRALGRHAVGRRDPAHPNSPMTTRAIPTRVPPATTAESRAPVRTSRRRSARSVPAQPSHDRTAASRPEQKEEHGRRRPPASVDRQMQRLQGPRPRRTGPARSGSRPGWCARWPG